MNRILILNLQFLFLLGIPENPYQEIECNIQACSASFRIFPRMSTLCRQHSFLSAAPSVAFLLCLRLSHSGVKPVGLRDFSLILSIKADYSFVFQASSGAACSCFHIIRNHYQHYGSSKGIDLLFSNNIIISKSGCIRLYREPTAEFTGNLMQLQGTCCNENVCVHSIYLVELTLFMSHEFPVSLSPKIVNECLV